MATKRVWRGHGGMCWRRGCKDRHPDGLLTCSSHRELEQEAQDLSFSIRHRDRVRRLVCVGCNTQLFLSVTVDLVPGVTNVKGQPLVFCRMCDRQWFIQRKTFNRLLRAPV